MTPNPGRLAYLTTLWAHRRIDVENKQNTDVDFFSLTIFIASTKLKYNIYIALFATNATTHSKKEQTTQDRERERERERDA